MRKPSQRDPFEVPLLTGPWKAAPRPSPVPETLDDIVAIVVEGQPTALLEVYGVDLDLRGLTVINAGGAS